MCAFWNETPLIYASMMQPDFQSEDIDSEATPAKRMRLSPRQPISSNTMLNTSALQRRHHRLSTTSPGGINSPRSLLDTPIVKRKSYREHGLRDGFSPVGTPTSILKVRSFIRKSLSPDVGGDARGTSTTPELLDENNRDIDSDSSITPLDRTTANAIKSISLNISATSFAYQRRRSPLGVSPRRPIQRTPRPAVHFEDLGRSSSRSSDGSATDTSTTVATASKQHLEVPIDVHREQTPEQDAQPSSKESSRSADDVFYSPNTSFSDKSENVTGDVTQPMEVDVQPEENISNESRRSSLKRKASDNSVKSRRSYKSTTPVTVQVARNIRESLRSRESLLTSNDSPLKSNESLLTSNESSPSTRSVKSRESISKSVESSPKIAVTLPAVKLDSSPRKSEVFPKVASRRSLSRQVLEQNALARAMQLPKMQTRLSLSKISPLENIDQHTVGVEVSYSKTVTSIVKKSSDSVTEETCDKSTMEMKNLFTTEKDPDSSAQIIKHLHNESSSKSSLKKVTEVLDESSEDSKQLDSFASSFTRNGNDKSDYHVLSFSSDIDDSMLQNTYQSEPEKDSSSVMYTSISKEEDNQNTVETEASRIESNKINTDVTLEDINTEINQNKKANLSETVFEDISSIVEESEESDEEVEEQMETCEYIPTKISTNLQPIDKGTTEDKQQEVQENLNVDEHSKDSSVDSEKNSDQSSDDNVVVEAEIHQTVSRESNTASSDGENDEEEENKVEEQESEEENCLVSSSEDETSEEEKISDQDDCEEEEEEELEEEIEQEQVAAEDSEDEHESKSRESEITSEDNSSRSSDVIEIKSSSEESLEELKLNYSGETIGHTEEENENEESEQEENESEQEENESEQEDDANVLDQNVETLEEIVEAEVIIEENEGNLNLEIVETEPDLQVETEQAIENMDHIDQEVELEIEDIQEVEQDTAEDIAEVEEIQQEIIQDVEESIELPEDIRLEIEECIREEEERSMQEDEKGSVQEDEEKSLQEDDIGSRKDSNVQMNEAMIEKEAEVDITDKVEESLKPKPETCADSSKSISQDCLEVMSHTESQEELNQTDILCHLPQDAAIQKIELQLDAPIEDIPFAEEEAYVPNRRSKRISSKNTKKEPELVTTPSRISTRRRSSIDVKEQPVEEILLPRSTRRRSASVDVEAKSSLEEASKPALRPSTRRRSASVDIDAKSNLVEETESSSKPAPRTSTRKRSASIDIDAKHDLIEEIEKSSKPAQRASRKKGSANVDVDAKSSLLEETKDSLKPTTRTLRRRSTSIDIEASPKPDPRTSTRKRSTSVDVEAKPSLVEETEELLKPATRTLRKRSTSVDIEEEISKARTPRRKRSTSVDAEEPPSEGLPKRSTRASSVVNLPVIEEEVQSARRTTRASSVESSTASRSKRGSSLEPKPSSPARRGRKRSIQADDVIAEENESVSSEQAKRTALEEIPGKIEEYSATHRLTRRQKMIMEKSLELQEMKKLQQAEIKPRVADIDPIKLLDKESFTGSPDLEERHHRSSSPASSVGTASSVATLVTPETGTPQRSSRRGGRRTSQSTPPTTAIPGTPRRSSRTASRDTPVDDVSSVRSVPVVELDRMDITRYRSLSPTALHAESAAPSPRSRRKSTKKSILPVQTDLSKISEEISAEPNHESSEELATATKDTQPKRGRPKKINKEKTDSEEPQSSQSFSPKSQSSKASSEKHGRTKLYQPLEEYVLKYSAYKTRKSFKEKKLTRK